MGYAYKVSKDSNGELLVTFPDVPEAATSAEREEDIPRLAAEALETAFDFYFDDRREVPAPGRHRGLKRVALPALVSAKVALHNEMLAQGVRKAELARRLDMAPPNVERIFNLRHSTKIETIESALAVLGKRLEIRLG